VVGTESGCIYKYVQLIQAYMIIYLSFIGLDIGQHDSQMIDVGRCGLSYMLEQSVEYLDIVRQILETPKGNHRPGIEKRFGNIYIRSRAVVNQNEYTLKDSSAEGSGSDRKFLSQ